MVRPWKKPGDKEFAISYQLRLSAWAVETVWAEDEKEARKLFKQRVGRPIESIRQK